MNKISRNITSSFAVLAALFSQSTLAEVTLVLPDSVHLIAINGLKPEIIDNSSIRNVMLPDGQNQIVFQYKPMVKENDSFRSVSSGITVAKFSSSNTKLSFELPTYRRLSQAQANIDHFEWSLQTAQGNKVEIIKDTITSSGSQFNRNYLQDVMDYNLKGGIAAITTVGNTNAFITSMTSDASVVQSNAVESMQIPTSEQLTNNMSQLKYWYMKATAEERKEFRKWLVDQE